MEEKKPSRRNDDDDDDDDRVSIEPRLLAQNFHVLTGPGNKKEEKVSTKEQNFFEETKEDQGRG